MSYTEIDRVNGRTIRKLHSPDKTKTFGHISGVKNEAGDLTDVQQHTCLTQAREYCGFSHDLSKQKKTAPKSSYVQNLPGYDPHSVSKGK